MQPSWLNNYMGGYQPYGATPTPYAEPNWFQQAIPSQTIQPYGATPIDPSSAASAGGMDANMAMLALRVLQDSQPRAMPMAQNSMPMGRSMGWQDILKSYGITGLMG